MAYFDDLAIDKNNLDEECVFDAGTYDAWARAETKARSFYDWAKDNLKLVEDQVELELRRMAKATIKARFDIDNITEGTYRVLVSTDERVRMAKHEYLDAKKKLDEAETARRSMEKRGARIDNLVYLHGQGYFGRVKGHHAKAEAVAALKKKYAEAVNEVFPDGEPQIPTVDDEPEQDSVVVEREVPPAKTAKVKKTKKQKENGDG